jgi:hypothetical protein
MVKAQPRVCILICTRRELETRAISSVTIMAASQPMSSPSYFSGITVPKKPSSPMGSMAPCRGSSGWRPIRPRWGQLFVGKFTDGFAQHFHIFEKSTSSSYWLIDDGLQSRKIHASLTECPRMTVMG